MSDKRFMNLKNILQNLKMGGSAQQTEFQKLSSEIESLLDSARLLFNQSEALKKVVAAEKTSVEKSSSASNEIASMVGTTASAAGELSQTAISSNEAVQNSVKALESLTSLIQNVNESSQTLQVSVGLGLQEISSVTKTMNEIKNKAKVINEIVFQTKLLSFNASVEAARAGEFGRGFSVVADEMSKLAVASGSASKEIESILDSSVKQTQSQIENVTQNLEIATKEIVESINTVSEKSKELSTIFSELTGYSKLTEEKSEQISTATKEQDIGVQEISRSLHELEQSSSELDQMAQASYKNSADLANKVEKISSDFSRLLTELGYKIVKIEKPFDFNAALSAHIDWKMKLSRYMTNPDHSLNPDKVCVDNACALGKWLYGDGQTYNDKHPQIFSHLKSSHAEFHKTAAKVITAVHEGNKKLAESLMAPNGPYMRVSEQTIDLIQELQGKVEGESESEPTQLKRAA